MIEGTKISMNGNFFFKGEILIYIYSQKFLFDNNLCSLTVSMDAFNGFGCLNKTGPWTKWTWVVIFVILGQKKNLKKEIGGYLWELIIINIVGLLGGLSIPPLESMLYCIEWYNA